jgi:hypothetical protein
MWGILTLTFGALALFGPTSDATAVMLSGSYATFSTAFAYLLMRRGSPPRVFKWVVLVLMFVTGAVLAYFAAYALMGAV